MSALSLLKAGRERLTEVSWEPGCTVGALANRTLPLMKDDPQGAHFSDYLMALFALRRAAKIEPAHTIANWDDHWGSAGAALALYDKAITDLQAIVQ